MTPQPPRPRAVPPGAPPAIVVHGARSGSGKTRIIELALGALEGWAAMKVTPHLRHAPPGSAADGLVLSGAEIPPKPGSDTDRYIRAGASRVVWVQARPENLPRRLEEAFGKLGGAPGVLVEGGFAADLLPEAPAVFVSPHDEPAPKEPARRRAAGARAWVWTWAAGDRDPPALPSPEWTRGPLSAGIPQFRIRLDQLEEWDAPEFVDRLRAWARG